MMRQFLPYIVPLLLMVVVIRRASRTRTINPSRMWIAPLVYVILAVTTLAAGQMPSPLFLAIFLAAALAGAGLGYLRARHQTLSVDPKSGKISSQPTTLGAMLVLGLFAVRFGLKAAFPDLSSSGHGGNEVTQGTEALLIFAVAMLIAQAIFLWLRTRPLVASRAAATASSAGE